MLNRKAILGLLAVLLLSSGIVRGDPSPPPPELSAASVSSFFDDFISAQMELRHAPGAVCIVVKDGRILFKKGYGFSDVEARLPVSPDTTIFSVGSISKLFTTLAALQLVERGELSLDEDVAADLPGVKLVNPFSTRLQLRHLLTHMSGFDQRYVGIAVRRRNELLEPLEYVRLHPPVCMMEPGTQISYSEEDHLVAGALIESKAGIPFTAYVQQHLLDPLSMHDTTFVPRDDTYVNHARGYEYNDGALEPMPILYVRQVPSGGMSSTGADLAKFMTMLLDGGSANGHQVLSPRTLKQLAERQFAYPGQEDGIALGFYRHIMNGQIVLTHGGVALGTACNLFILPQRGTGAFVCYNLFDTRLLDPPPRQFVDHFFPQARQVPVLFGANEMGTRPISSFVGEYRHVSFSRETMEKVGSLFERIYVRCYDGKTLVTNALPAGGDANFTRTGPTTFMQTDGDATLTFLTNAGGRVIQMVAGPEAYFRADWYENPILHLHFIELTLLALVWVLLGWPTLRWLRRRPAIARRLGPPGKLMLADRALWLVAAVYLLFLGGFYAIYLRTPNHVFIYGLPIAMKAMLVLPLVAAGLTACCIAAAVLRIPDRTLSIIAKCHFATLTSLAAGLTAILYYWNLVGLNW